MFVDVCVDPIEESLEVMTLALDFDLFDAFVG